MEGVGVQALVNVIRFDCVGVQALVNCIKLHGIRVSPLGNIPVILNLIEINHRQTYH